MDEPLRVDVLELLLLARLGAADVRVRAPPSLPLVIVELDGGTPEAASDQLDELMLGALPYIFIGLARVPLSEETARVAARLDLLIAAPGISPLRNAVSNEHFGSETVERIASAVGAAPCAAVSLALLLRNRFHRAPAAGLVAESATYSALQAGPEFAGWLARRPPRRADDNRERVRVRRAGDTLHVTLNRPAVRNAVDTKMRDELHEALLVALAEPRLRLLITGEGPAFCSGGDLTEFGTATDPALAHIVRLTSSIARMLWVLSERTEVRVHGACIGAGIELSAFASRLVGSADAFFALPEVSMGLIPGAGGTVSVPRRIGPQRTLYLALTGDQIEASTALEWGLLDGIVA